MGSTRLPGKVLRPLAGKPLLSHVIARVCTASSLSGVVLATSQKPEDDAVAELARSLGVAVYRGSESDVLDRYYCAAREAQADTIVRVTGDCPMHQGAVIDQIVAHFTESGADYAAGPANIPEGFDTEVFSMRTLERAHRDAVLPSEREHVTLYFRNHPELFALAPAWSTGGEDYSTLHLSVDTPEDFAFAEAVFAELGQDFGVSEVVALVARRPDLRAINAGNTGFEGLYKSLAEDEEFKKKAL